MKTLLFLTLSFLTISLADSFDDQQTTEPIEVQTFDTESIEVQTLGFKVEVEEMALRCKWQQIVCPGGGGTAEHCTTAGDGTGCRCGKVTRECGGDDT